MASKYPSALVEVGKLLLAVPALYAAFVLVGLGPVGWAVLAAAVLLGGAIWYDGGDGEREGSERTNCPHCGAPNDADTAVCDYCEESLAAE